MLFVMFRIKEDIKKGVAYPVAYGEYAIWVSIFGKTYDLLALLSLLLSPCYVSTAR